jgi:hypothetical protein
MKRITTDHEPLPRIRRLIALDAIYTWQVNQELKMQAVRLQADSIRVMQQITGLSKARCYSIVEGKTTLDDYKVREGFRTIKDKDIK